jgi:dipeptidyl-peptidase-4
MFSKKNMLKQPAVILHELAHGYHDQILGFEHKGILEAYQAAKQRGDYEKVLHVNGGETKHYALTDHKEYFAEATEAMLYRNDFYPFVSSELKQHDPKLHALLEEIWQPHAKP